MIKEVFEVSRAVAPRNRYEVLASLMEEVGELATEVAICEGYSKKPHSEDHVIGEAVDIITCALDIIWVDSDGWLSPDYLEDLVMRILKRKLEKWRQKKSQMNS